MTTFNYRARDRRGALVVGRLEAANAPNAAEQLIGTGLTPVDISEANKYTALSTYYFGHNPANRFELSRANRRRANRRCELNHRSANHRCGLSHLSANRRCE
jgi:type II secretory pathway component PulF